MNSSFTCISVLANSNISKPSLVNILNELSSKLLRSYLKLANIYDGNSNKIKSDLIEMIIYGCINGKLKNTVFDDISIDELLDKKQNGLKENTISIKLLPGYGNIS